MSVRAVLVVTFLALAPQAAMSATAWIKQTSRPAISYCGDVYAPPFANPLDAGRRSCPPAEARAYTPRHRGIGFDILDLESEACFVPDESYRLLDDVIDEVASRLSAHRGPARAQSAVALDIATVTGEVMAARGFGLYVPTETLGDALARRSGNAEPPRYVFDCDTGSMILMTVAENLSLPASLVEITLRSGSGHNYVRWEFGGESTVDWDMNGRQQCLTPRDVRPYQGRSMTRDEALGYAYLLRAALWKQSSKIAKEIDDLREATRRRPDHPAAYNNLAWLIATRDLPNPGSLQAEALRGAEKAVAIERHPNYLDTLACVHAAGGRFEEAARIEREAAEKAPEQETYKRRVEQFEAAMPRDCRGED